MISGFSYPLCFVLAACLASIAAGVQIDLVPVGDPGNAPDMRYNLQLRPQGTGRVDYVYHIAQYEVTAGQYTEFLNAVARADPYGLYRAAMDLDVAGEACNIKRTGESGAYSYAVAPDWANRPVNRVSWLDAARFANWLTNGQPTGAQDLATTEDGSYLLNGAVTADNIATVTRKPDALFVLPSLDEWYKAAYFDPAMPGGSGYWDYATRNDQTPSNSLDPGGTNNANFHPLYGTFTIGEPYYRTEVGTFINSPSPYNTFDQSGNVDEWLETGDTGDGRYRKLWGGTYNSGDLPAWGGGSVLATLDQFSVFGFRVALVPEPSTLSLLLIAGSIAFRRRARGASRFRCQW